MSRELTRRDFLGDAALVGVASAIGIQNALASQPAGANQSNASATPPRVRRSSFDDGWSFAKGDIAGAEAPITVSVGGVPSQSGGRFARGQRKRSAIEGRRGTLSDDADILDVWAD